MEKNLDNIKWKSIDEECKQIIENKDNDLEEFDWFLQILIYKLSKKQMYNAYINTIALYYSILQKSIDEELFEISSKLKEVILIEKLTFVQTLTRYYKYNKKDEKQINKINTTAENLFLKN